MKHKLSVILTVVAVFGLNACGSNGSGSSANTHTAGKNTSKYPSTAHDGISNNNPPVSTNNPLLVKAPIGKYAEEIQKAVANTNKLRAEKGLKPLRYDPKLAAYAQRRAEEIVKKFSHTRPDGQSWSVGIRGGGGENIAAGHATADKTVLEQWRKSIGHYNNMVNQNYTSIGIGLVYIPNSQYGYYWVQIFGMDGTRTEYSFATPPSPTRANIRPNTIPQNPNHSLKQLIVDGISIPVDAADNGVWHKLTGSNYSGLINGYENSRFGIIRTTTGEKVFYQGLPTPSEYMPQTGRFSYNGHAVVAAEAGELARLQARFYADFSNKKLNGILSDKGQTAFTIDADIHGNTFSAHQDASVETQGGFFGKNAAELSGVFREKATGKSGAFGARK